MVSYLPAILLLALECIILPFALPETGVARKVLRYLGLGLGVRYYLWRIFCTLPDLELSVGCILAYTLLGSELLFFVPMVFKYKRGDRERHRSSEANDHQGWWDAAPPRVSVLIPTYNESADILYRTIIGATSINYSNYDVWVLDDGRRPWLEQLAAKLGVNYLRREQNTSYKAGNLNNALSVLAQQGTPPEFIAVFDADFVARGEFINRTLSLMYDPSVAIVQTPQFFFNPDPFQYAFDAQTHWPDDVRSYAETYLPQMDAEGVAECCGTSFLARYSHVQLVGGIATESLADDTLTSRKLRQRGLKTVYLDEFLSSGLAVEGVSEYLTQRRRWCLGNLQISLGPWGNAAKQRGYNRVIDLLYDLYWPLRCLSDWTWTVLPVMFLFTGYAMIQATTADFVYYFAPLMALIVGEQWMNKGTYPPILCSAWSLLSTWAVFPATRRALTDLHNNAFTTTTKGRCRGRYTIHWSILIPSAAAMLLNFAGMIFSTTSWAPGSSSLADWAWIYYFAITRILSLFIVCGVAVERPKYRASERFQTRLEGVLSTPTATQHIQVHDVAEFGCLLSSPEALQVGTTCSLCADKIGRFRATVVRDAGKGQYGLKFKLHDGERAALVRTLYCSDDFFRPARDWRTFAPLWRSLFGLTHVRA